MSFDLYIVGFRNGEASGAPRDLVKAALGPKIRWDSPDSGSTEFTGGNDGCSILLGPLKSDPDLICCVSVNRPLALEEFNDALFRVMKLGTFALVFPGFKAPLIAQDSAAEHVPADLGSPVVIRCGSEILKQIQSQ